MTTPHGDDALLQFAIDSWGGETCTKFKDKGCVLDLQDLASCVSIRADRKEDPLVDHTQQMCDCIIFWVPAELIVGIVEMKSTGRDALEIHQQIQNGWKLAARLIQKAGSLHRVNTIILAALKRRRWNPMVVRKMDKLRVRISKKGLKIHLKRSGTHLRDLPQQQLRKRTER